MIEKLHSMKRWWVIVLLTLITYQSSLITSWAQTSNLKSKYTKEHPLVYVDAWDLWPYVFLDDEGNPTGYNVELLKMIFEQLEIPFVVWTSDKSLRMKDLPEVGQHHVFHSVLDFFRIESPIFDESLSIFE